MGQFTVLSATYYNQFTIGGVPSGWNKQANTGSNPVYGSSIYEEQGGPIDEEVEQGEVINPDYSPNDATFLGKVTFGGRDFYFIQDEFGYLLGSTEANLPYSEFPPSIDPSDVMDENMPACFLAGTAIGTPDGRIAVEDLRIGSEILTSDGARVQVKWIGRHRVSTRFGPADRLMPVRIRAGALGAGCPERDLLLTADHALLIDSVLINAGALVNGDGISWVPLAELGEGYTVYHVETEAHDVILAEGVAAESFVDYAGRRAFDNHDEYIALYGEDRTIPELTLPRISSARHVPVDLRLRLARSRAA
ncbi:Hint domain-containing protein [Antarctobacter sp.]|uniref:Hint domain-containing protein n=1 Tax=Antarctobacter sp. TaxID=1872577 RepID=UPI003A93E221